MCNGKFPISISGLAIIQIMMKLLYNEQAWIKRYGKQQQILGFVENLLINLLMSFLALGNAHITVTNNQKWRNFVMSEGYLRDTVYPTHYRNISFSGLRSRNRFTMTVYLLAKIYELFIHDLTCTYREFFYDNSELYGNHNRLRNVIRDVCGILNAAPWEIGILSSTKAIVAGFLSIYLENNNIIDCRYSYGATLLPNNLRDIEFLRTDAKFIFIVEKFTIFEKLLTLKIFENIGTEMILITGKGFPDYNTRMIVNHLGCHHHLPVYILVDADPYGIEIMCIYRFGSRAMARNGHYLACPHARWIGIHPSELTVLAIPTVPLTQADKRKLYELLNKPYIGENIRKELQIMLNLKCKAEIDNVLNNTWNCLLNDYIPNKINRNLVI